MMGALPEESSEEAIQNINYPALEELYVALLEVVEAYRSLMELHMREGAEQAAFREARRGAHTFSQLSYLMTRQSDLMRDHLDKNNNSRYPSNRNRLHLYSAKLSEQVKSMQYPFPD